MSGAIETVLFKYKVSLDAQNSTDLLVLNGLSQELAKNLSFETRLAVLGNLLEEYMVLSEIILSDPRQQQFVKDVFLDLAVMLKTTPAIFFDLVADNKRKKSISSDQLNKVINAFITPRVFIHFLVDDLVSPQLDNISFMLLWIKSVSSNNKLRLLPYNDLWKYFSDALSNLRVKFPDSEIQGLWRNDSLLFSSRDDAYYQHLMLALSMKGIQDLKEQLNKEKIESRVKTLRLLLFNFYSSDDVAPGSEIKWDSIDNRQMISVFGNIDNLIASMKIGDELPAVKIKKILNDISDEIQSIFISSIENPEKSLIDNRSTDSLLEKRPVGEREVHQLRDVTSYLVRHCQYFMSLQ